MEPPDKDPDPNTLKLSGYPIRHRPSPKIWANAGKGQKGKKKYILDHMYFCLKIKKEKSKIGEKD